MRVSVRCKPGSKSGEKAAIFHTSTESRLFSHLSHFIPYNRPEYHPLDLTRSGANLRILLFPAALTSQDTTPFTQSLRSQSNRGSL